MFLVYSFKKNMPGNMWSCNEGPYPFAWNGFDEMYEEFLEDWHPQSEILALCEEKQLQVRSATSKICSEEM